MVTQSANLADLVTTLPVSGSRAKTADLKESFQTYVAEGGNRWKQQECTGEVQRKQTEQLHKDTYEKETVSTATSLASRDKVQNLTEQSETTELGEEQTEQMEEDIRMVIKDVLDMDDSEIDEVLASMNSSLFGLLQPEQLQEFLLTATETEPMDLLTDSSLIQVFQELEGRLTDLLQQTGISAEQFESLTALPEEEPDMDFLPIEQTQTTETMIEMPEDAEVEETDGQTAQAAEEKPAKERQEAAGKADITGFSEQEETTGIRVTVESSQAKAGQGNRQQKGQTSQAVATDVVNQLSQAVNELEETPVSFTSEVQQSEIVRQVVEQIKVSVGSDMNRIEVQLYPQQLGRVQIQVMMKNGVMTAQIHAETEMAKEAIEGQLQQLKEAFQEKNLQVEAVEVSVSTPDFRKEQERQEAEKNQQTRAGRRRGRLEAMGLTPEELSEEEQDSQERLEAQGASVEFTA